MVLFLNGSSSGTPPGRTGHIAVSYEKYMLVWGGYRENPGTTADTFFSGAEIWIYSCITEKWYMKTIQEAYHPPGASGCAAVTIDDSMYLFGGNVYNGEGFVNRLYKLDLEDFTWQLMRPSGVPPFPVDKTVVWQYNKKLYVFGGFGILNAEPPHDFEFVFYEFLSHGWTNQFYEYDQAKNKWTIPFTTGTLPSARAAHAVAVLDGKAYIFGGRRDVRMNDLHCLDMATMKWSGEIDVKGPVPVGRSWHSLTASSDQFLVLYGGISKNNVVLSDCWLLDTKAVIWIPVELPFQKPRLWHCACLSIFNEVLIYGGCKYNIYDIDRIPEHDADIVEIRLAPKSLFRICVDKLVRFPRVYLMGSSLPRILQHLLVARLG